MSVPKWPDFCLTGPLHNGNKLSYSATTDTGRPVTPIFEITFSFAKGFPVDPMVYARERLDAVYAKAHPKGCPRVR